MINSIISFFSLFDLREVFYAAFGAFVGFWLTILLEKRKSNDESKVKRDLLLSNIVVELKETMTDIRDSNPQDTLFIDIPIYEALVQSGAILDFVDAPFYVDLMKTYSSIRLLIECENEGYDVEEKHRIRMDAVKRINSLVDVIDNSVDRRK